MRGRSRILLLVLLLCGSLAPAGAWAPETRLRVIDEAIRFMPASLRLVLEQQRSEVRRGMLEPMTAEDGLDHRPPWGGGRLEARIDEQARALTQALAGRTFTGVARLFGELAHYVADAGFPPAAGRDPDGIGRYEHFAAFCESRRARFPLVFYGHANAPLAAGDFRAFAIGRLQTAAEDDLALARAYRAAGDPPDPSHFDDRSVPFALGSLAYSRTVTDIVRIWIRVWERAGGDMDRTPYIGVSPPPGRPEAPEGP